MAAQKNGNQAATEFDDSKFSDEGSLGFPPYWNPEEGASIVGTVAHFDGSDPEFERWVIQASRSTQCHRGPKAKSGENKGKAAEDVLVKRGEFFSLSNYAQLRLHIYIGLEVKLTAVKKTEVEKGEMWNFKINYTPETGKIVAQRRMDALRGSAAPEARQVTESATA